MYEEKKENLKIQLRAVKFSTTRVLEYRLDPDQDLSYEKFPHTFWGHMMKKLFPKKYIGHFDTNWHQPELFANEYVGLYEYNYYLNWHPIWCRDQETLNMFKNKFKTYGDIMAYVNDRNKGSYERWKIARALQLEKEKTLY